MESFLAWLVCLRSFSQGENKTMWQTSYVNYFVKAKISSSETQGQIKGPRESLNGRKNIYGTKKSKERREEPLGTMSYQTSSKRSPPFWLLIGARKTQPHFPAHLDCPSSSLSAPGSPRMLKSMRDSNHYI